MSRVESPTGLQSPEDRLEDRKYRNGRKGREDWRSSEVRDAAEPPAASRAPECRKRCAAPGSFARGALEAAWITAAFVALGLGYAEVLKRAPAERAVYAPAFVAVRAAEDPSIWLVDGFNVVQRALLGGRERGEWWTARHRTELLERAARFDDAEAEIWVVFDGSEVEPEGSDADGPHRVFAPSADDWLLARVRAAENPERIAVVTADRQLAERARRRGARVVGPSEFLRRCAS
jgi:predicted RNA-binding protein with PIN domain